MSVTQITTRDTRLEKGDLGTDLTFLVNDSGTLKVEIGSIVEYGGSLYEVASGDGRQTPTGTAQAGAYLFFTGSAFVWSNTPGTYDAALGGVYDGSSYRQCRWKLQSATVGVELVNIDEYTGIVLRNKVVEIGNWNMDSTDQVSVDYEIDGATIRSISVTIRNDAGTSFYHGSPNIFENDGSVVALGLNATLGSEDVLVTTNTLLAISRSAGGLFDGVQFNDTPYNRGWVTIWYEV